MKKIFLTILTIATLFVTPNFASAQEATTTVDTTVMLQQHNILEELASKNIDGAKVTISSKLNIEFEKPDFSKELKGYRVRIFFDNKQSARSDAENASKKFKELYPSMNTYIVYEPPYFKVTAGDFISRSEAVVVWGKILPTFPTAFLVNEPIPFTTLLTRSSVSTPTLVDPTALNQSVTE